MASLEERDDTYFTTVRGLCGGCRRVAPARVFFRAGAVWQQSLCPDCAAAPAMIAADQDWYLANVLSAFPDGAPLPGARLPLCGCPHDCGPCAWHASPRRPFAEGLTTGCRLPVASCRLSTAPAAARDAEALLAEALGRLRAGAVGGLVVEAAPGPEGLPLDAAVGMVCRASGGRLAPADFAPRPDAHPLCWAVCRATGFETLGVHAPMNAETFDCSRAMLCPETAPAGEGRLAPGCALALLAAVGEEATDAQR